MLKYLRSTRIRAIAVAALAMVFVCAFTVAAAAYTTPEYNIEVEVGKDYSFKYKEDITVDFGDEHRHGIFRNIPMDSEYKITDISVGDGNEYDVSVESDNKVIRIGSADEYVTGVKHYPISYVIKGIAENNTELDIMYIDLLSTGWETDIDHVKAVVHYPEDMQWDDISFIVGEYGSATYGLQSEYGEWTVDEQAHTITFEGKNLPKGVGVTLKADLPDGYWVGALNYEWTKQAAVIALGIALAIIALLRLTVGRNKRAVQPVEFYAPDNLTPAQVGYLVDGFVDQKDITSTFFYLADRGYMDIDERETKGKYNEFEFTKIESPENEPKSVMRFFRGIFGSKGREQTPEGKELRVSSLSIGTRMSKAYLELPSIIREEFSDERKIFTGASKKADTLSKLVFFLAIIAMIVINGIYASNGESIGLYLLPGFFVGIVFMVLLKLVCKAFYYRKTARVGATVFKLIIFSAIYGFASLLFIVYMASKVAQGGGLMAILLAALFIFAPLLIVGMRTRTQWSNDMYGRIMGFKNFIKTAEVDRLNALIEENPKYFYNVLPYAYVFGLTEKWAKNFEGIQVPAPEWYTGDSIDRDRNVFNPYVLARSMDHVHDSIQHQVSMSKDTGGGFSSGSGGSSGGFSSGGGFSGGGFGGGGGGAW